MDNMYTGDLMFQFVPIFIGIIFIIVIGSVIITAVKGAGQWQKNNDSPRLSVPAIVTSKRTNVSRSAENELHSTYTTYYATFEFESGDRTEFILSGSEYGQLAERDRGTLSFQGTRYIGFQRSQ
ncbi:DUF2500 domain-containing protein [Mesobacillus foraminis]|uniref:DUF2500 domain-containing protein n=1 Tax=Mesobacillus foraminis TaxID=279826 RepID=UPI0035D0B0A2